MNLQLSFCVAQNATTRLESTVKHCAFRGNILTVAVVVSARYFRKRQKWEKLVTIEADEG